MREMDFSDYSKMAKRDRNLKILKQHSKCVYNDGDGLISPGFWQWPESRLMLVDCILPTYLYDCPRYILRPDFRMLSESSSDIPDYQSFWSYNHALNKYQNCNYFSPENWDIYAQNCGIKPVLSSVNSTPLSVNTDLFTLGQLYLCSLFGQKCWPQVIS